jgi:hypothetical protein
MNRVWQCSGQAGSALLVLLAIADFADDDGQAFPSIRTLARKARLSERQVQRVIAEPVNIGELKVKPGRGTQGSHLFRVTVGEAAPASATPRQNVAPDNVSPPRECRTGVTPATPEGVTLASPKPSHPEPSGTITPLPLTDAIQQPGMVKGSEANPHPPPTVEPIASHTTAWELASALYRGLGSDLQAVTEPVRRRELAIAEQLVGIGATPAEAEAYARETRAQSARVAAIDLCSFERERVSWKARRDADHSGAARRIDRTGQPPGGVDAGALARSLFGVEP